MLVLELSIYTFGYIIKWPWYFIEPFYKRVLRATLYLNPIIKQVLHDGLQNPTWHYLQVTSKGQ
jgi:hypothetical protein